MEALEFINNYETYLAEIEQVIKPEYQSAVDRLRDNDPHDLVRPETWFPSTASARGYVFSLFLNETKK